MYCAPRSHEPPPQKMKRASDFRVPKTAEKAARALLGSLATTRGGCWAKRTFHRLVVAEIVLVRETDRYPTLRSGTPSLAMPTPSPQSRPRPERTQRRLNFITCFLDISAAVLLENRRAGSPSWSLATGKMGAGRARGVRSTRPGGRGPDSVDRDAQKWDPLGAAAKLR